jgi:hypothetical protein
MTFRTLEEVRADLLSRLGMGGMGASGGASQSLMDSFIRNGQYQLYMMTDWKHLTWYEDKTIGYDQNQLDYPTDTQRNKRILRIETVINGQWKELREGIETQHWNTMDTNSYPERYERLDQLLIYPKANATYTIRYWYVKDLGRLTQNSDPCTLDDEMVLLHATANAKAHYRHPDAETYQGQLNTLLASIKGQQFGSNKVFTRSSAPAPAARPMVLGRDD